MSWQRRAACRGVQTVDFFSRDPVKVAEARAVCATCPVREPCLDDALALPSAFGIRAGMNAEEHLELARAVRWQVHGYLAL